MQIGQISCLDPALGRTSSIRDRMADVNFFNGRRAPTTTTTEGLSVNHLCCPCTDDPLVVEK